eukprot:1988577-Alexandrium_andersonii.AAC.1
MRRLTPPEARDALPHPWLVRGRVAVRVGGFRSASRHMPRGMARFRGTALPCRVLIHTGPRRGWGVW